MEYHGVEKVFYWKKSVTIIDTRISGNISSNNGIFIWSIYFINYDTNEIVIIYDDDAIYDKDGNEVTFTVTIGYYFDKKTIQKDYYLGYDSSMHYYLLVYDDKIYSTYLAKGYKFNYLDIDRISGDGKSYYNKDKSIIYNISWGPFQ